MAGQLHFQSGKTFRYQAIQSDLVGHGAYGRVFKGHFKSNTETSWRKGLSEEKQAAVKRVLINFQKEKWMDIETDREVVALKELRHPFIVTLYAVEDDDNFRNFIFELCQANLEEFITKKYEEVKMPEEIEGLYQMASGLKFIHEKKMIHRDIKPENVLIYLADGQRACLKIADLGFTKPLNEDGIHYDLASGLKGTEYYMAPELLVLRNLNGRVILDEKCTTASDVFAAGCTFFRYCAGGVHPFGHGFNIEGNIVTGNPVNLTAQNIHIENGKDPTWIIDLVVKMVKFNPEERPSFPEIVELLGKRINCRPFLQNLSDFQNYIGGESLPHVIVVQSSMPRHLIKIVGNLQFDRGNRIGVGSYGYLYPGTFNGEKVAVKRVELINSPDNRELENNQKLSRLNHPNIVQLKHYEEDDDFGYFAMELCAATLEDYCKGKYQGPMPTDEQVLFQLASGLEYIHSKGILCQGVKPQNVLISLTKPVQMKYCDFGLNKSVGKLYKVNYSGTFSLSEVKRNKNWWSPEELQMMNKENEILIHGSVKSDIFSAGILFIYFLLRGKHPFGNGVQIQENILKNNAVNLKELSEDHDFARPFVIQMIENEPEDRISLSEVIEYLKPLQPSPKLSLMQYDLQNLLSSTGTLSLVYDIVTFEGSSLAVKRVPIEDCTTKPFDELKQLDHSNIIRLLHFDKDDVYKYFGMELCVASLDQIFLPEDDPKKYSGPILSDEQFCFQIISGLEYIHRKRLVHGSIKPTNILISSSENDPQIKLSDFGLTTTSRLNEGHTTQRSIGGFLSSRYWLAPELLDSGQNEPTKESDIFSAGSVFFYFLSRGRHLFGDLIHKILSNTLKGIQCNSSRIQTQTQIGYYSIIRWMTTKYPKQRSTLTEVTEQMKLLFPVPSIYSIEKLKKIGDIEYSREKSHIIGTGGQASVFLGLSKGSIVAVKRIIIDSLENEQKKLKVYGERDLFEKLNHRNIIKLIDYGENRTFMVLALEKCLTSLDNYCRKPNVCRIIPVPSDQEVLLQMAQGLEYIHSQGLIHRDVKPHNILISGDNPAVIKWADFGMSRAVITGSKTFSWSKLQGTDRWLAPELIAASREDKVKGSQKCDIFALGCCFFFFLVPGIHPFGDSSDNSTQNNIVDKNPVNFDELKIQHFADIIKGMIENDRESRSKLPDVVQKLLKCTASSIDNVEKFLAPRGVSNDLEMMSPSPVKKPRKEND